MTNTPPARPALPPALGACYGLLALPLAFVALPMYVNLPHFYATQYAIPLTTLGLVLLLSRLLDAVVDPWFGRLSDLVYGQSPRVLGWVATALTALLFLSFGALFLPPAFSATPAYVAWVAVFVSLCHLTYSGLGILHQAWATRLGGGAVQQGRVIAWREAAGLVGVVLASLLPAMVGWTLTTLLLGLLLALGTVDLASRFSDRAFAIAASPAKPTTSGCDTATAASFVFETAVRVHVERHCQCSACQPGAVFCGRSNSGIAADSAMVFGGLLFGRRFVLAGLVGPHSPRWPGQGMGAWHAVGAAELCRRELPGAGR